MKQYYLILAIILVGAFTLKAQTKVTGHASAEVVEMSSLRSMIDSHITIDKDYAGEINLGELTVQSARNTHFDVIANGMTLKGRTTGNTINTGVSSFTDIHSNLPDNNSMLLLTATVEDKLLADDYNGTMTIIISYN